MKPLGSSEERGWPAQKPEDEQPLPDGQCSNRSVILHGDSEHVVEDRREQAIETIADYPYSANMLDAQFHANVRRALLLVKLGAAIAIAAAIIAFKLWH